MSVLQAIKEQAYAITGVKSWLGGVGLSVLKLIGAPLKTDSICTFFTEIRSERDEMGN